MHAESKIGGSIVMPGEAGAQCKPTTASICVYVNDADSVYHRTIQAGGASVMELAGRFWSDRGGCVSDPAGNQWRIATHIEDVSVEEVEKRGQAWMQEHLQKAA